MPIHCSICDEFCGCVAGTYSTPVVFVCPFCIYVRAHVRHLFDVRYTHKQYYNDTHLPYYFDPEALRKLARDQVELLKEIWTENEVQK